jgi:DNA/RNA endonuclease G (NUC1)
MMLKFIKNIEIKVKKSMEGNRKIFILILIVILFLMVPFYNYKVYFISDKPNHLLNEYFENEKIIIDKNEWVVQYDIAQYSSILVEQLDGSIDIEALFFHSYSKKIDYIRNNVKCLILK